ncbi:MAG: tRNA (guanosine(37)-N1)-methyltransferase TrmD [Desulfobacteraceae bacterium]
MNFSVLTLFPGLLETFLQHGVIGRAIDAGVITGRVVNIRAFSADRHNTVDDKPYGGGCGMVMKPEPLDAAAEFAVKETPGAKVLLMTPQGSRFDQRKAEELAFERKDLILICGRYEGIDERVCAKHVDEEISVGDYVMTGGEVAAMAVIEAVARLLPGVLGGRESASEDSFADGRLEHNHYTRPEVFEGEPVPDVLLSGNHGLISGWRRKDSLIRTYMKRPDLFDQKKPTEAERLVLKQICRELEEIAGK